MFMCSTSVNVTSVAGPFADRPFSNGEQLLPLNRIRQNVAHTHGLGTRPRDIACVRNISQFGAHVWCYGPCPPVGTPVILDMKVALRQDRTFQLKAGALVIRVEEVLGSPAFAVITDLKLKQDVLFHAS